MRGHRDLIGYLSASNAAALLSEASEVGRINQWLEELVGKRGVSLTRDSEP
jgi:hypothetical protein